MSAFLFSCRFQLNKASQQLIENFEGSSSPSSSSNSSDEEVDKSKAHDGRCSRQRQLSRRKKIKSPWVRREYREKNTSPATSQPEGFEAAATCSSNADVEATVFDNSSSDQQVPKRPNTIHVANPAEQRRESRRALNLSDDGNQPRPRLRTRSQGRRGSATSQVRCAYAKCHHTLGPYIYDFRPEVGGGVLKFVTSFQILLVSNNRSIVNFCGWG